MKESFSSITKKELLAEQRLKRCCAFSLIYGFAFTANDSKDGFLAKKTNVENAIFLKSVLSSVLKNKTIEYDEKARTILLPKGIILFSTIAEYKEKIFKCENCIGSFLRALFLTCGTVNDPNNSYRLELSFDEELKRNSVYELMMEQGFDAKIASRKDKHIIYLKNSEQVENFLAKIGAVNATFAVMNSKIYKEVTNNVNRVANCDSANIAKAIKASEKYVEAILELRKNGNIDSLPNSLKETALLRIEFRELNFEQLGKKFSPPISKSGIYHRLEKILEIYNKQK